MRDSWQAVLKSADSKKSEAKSLRQELEKFLKSRDVLLSWLEELRTKITAAKGDKRELGSLARLMELKKTELTNINKLGNKLTAANSFKGQESSLTNINQYCSSLFSIVQHHLALLNIVHHCSALLSIAKHYSVLLRLLSIAKHCSLFISIPRIVQQNHIESYKNFLFHKVNKRN